LNSGPSKSSEETKTKEPPISPKKKKAMSNKLKMCEADASVYYRRRRNIMSFNSSQCFQQNGEEQEMRKYNLTKCFVLLSETISLMIVPVVPGLELELGGDDHRS
jgi:hypothetical protein